MALPSTIHRFRLDLSDVDRGRYETIDLRVARHPSEGPAYLFTRIIAYALNVEDGLELTDGLCVPDEPALRVVDRTGIVVHWIEVGNPSAKRLHKAAKAAARVSVYTYRDPAILLRELAGEKIHRSENIALFSIPPALLTALEPTLARDNAWRVLSAEGELSITAGETTVQGEVGRHRIGA